jgi:predicted AAA+ superfamily ATPase
LLGRLFAGDIPRITGAPAGRREYLERLLAGGFPEAQLRIGSARRRFFDSYVDSIVERDVADASRVRDPAAVGTLLRLVAARSGGLARYDSLARDAGVDGKTAKAHVDVLERLFLVRVRRAWHTNIGQRQVKAPKLYVADPGLLVALVGADARRAAEDDGFAGSLLETFVATELERQASWSPEPLSFWHYRDGEREVDIVIERPSGEVVGIEVKAGATVRPRDFGGLSHMRERLGDRLAVGLVLYAGEQTLPFGERLWAVPLCAVGIGPERPAQPGGPISSSSRRIVAASRFARPRYFSTQSDHHVAFSCHLRGGLPVVCVSRENHPRTRLARPIPTANGTTTYRVIVLSR